VKILQATTSRTWSGGTEQCFLLAKKMNEMGYETDVLTVKGSLLDEKLGELGIKRIYFPTTRKLDLGTAKKLAKLLEHYDIVNTHIPLAHWQVWLASFFCKKRPKIIYSRRVYYDISFLSAFTKYNIHTDAIIAISKEVEEKLRKRFFLRRKKIVLIPSGIDLERYDPLNVKPELREKLKISSDAIVVTNVANFQRVKGHLILFKAFKRLIETVGRKFVLLLAGRGTQSLEARKMIEDLEIGDYVVPLGFRRDVPQILKITDLFVFPSISEGLGSALLQAMAMKKIVIASYTGGIKNYLKHMENGIAVEPGSIDSLYRGLLTALENLDNERMKTSARETAEKFDIRSVARKTLDLYRELLGVSSS